MPDLGEAALAGQMERLSIFVSSTIDECAKQRREARATIQSLGFDPFVFEREGARTYRPQALYLGRLRRSQLAIGIYRASYGWVDEANGQTLSGLEDEYIEIRRLNLGLLAYIEKHATRDPRLTAIVDDILGQQTAYFFNADEDLTSVIHADIVTLLAQTFTLRRVAADQRAIAPQVTLDAIFKNAPYYIRRAGLDAALRERIASYRAVSVGGVAGAGKTVALAQYAADAGAPYVNGRGLDPRALLAKAADALLGNTADPSNPETFEEARDVFAEAWRGAATWPLVIDDPTDADLLWSELAAVMQETASGVVVIGSRQQPAGFRGGSLQVDGFTQEELALLETVVDAQAQRHIAQLPDATTTLPLTVRSAIRPLRDEAGDEVSLRERFLALKGPRREIIACLALGGAPLSLADISAVTDGAMDLASLSDEMTSLDDLVLEDASGYSLLHDAWATELAAVIQERAQFFGAIARKLITLFDSTGRGWLAFQVARLADDELAIVQAERSLREILYSGSIAHFVTAQQFLADHYRASGDRASLVPTLVSLAQIASSSHDTAHCAPLLAEAGAVAEAIGDEGLIDFVAEFAATYALQTAMSPATLSEVERIRDRYEEVGDAHSVARLLVEEGVAFQAVNRQEEAEPRFRRALAIFEEHEDAYGRELATRNLAGVLLASTATAAEGEQLLATLQPLRGQARERAWLCNILNRRYRDEKRYKEAEEVSREAIAIGESLGDRHVVAINQMALGNALRDDGRYVAALAAYEAAGIEGSAISRPEIYGRAARLAAACHNALSENAAGREAKEHAECAVELARRAISIFENSLGSHDHADAYDELGTALISLGREGEGWAARARGVALFLAAGDLDNAHKLERQLAHGAVDLPFDLAMQVMLIARGKTIDPQSPPLVLWTEAAVAMLEQAVPDVAAATSSMLVRHLIGAIPKEYLCAALDRCLRIVADCKIVAGHQNRALFLLNILAFTARHDLTRAEMLMLATLCLEGDEQIRLREIPTVGVQLVVEIGEGQTFLFTISAADESVEATYVALCLGAFLAGCDKRVTRDFIAPYAENPAAFDVMTTSLASVGPDLLATIQPHLQGRAVTFVGFGDREEGPPRITAFCSGGVPAAMPPGDKRAGAFEIVLVDFLSALVSAAYDVNLQTVEQLPKMKELLRYMLW
jgi:tetratricopeptide (TPR) repeat protein